MSKLQNEFVQIVTTKIVQVYCVGFEAQIPGQAGANCESKFAQCIFPNYEMYLSTLQNLFVQVYCVGFEGPNSWTGWRQL